MRYWIGPYVWDVVSMPSPHWRAPNGVVGAIDLRPLSAQGTAVVASGIGFFATDDLTDLGLLGSYTLIGQGDLRALNLIAKDRSNFAAALGLATLNGATLVECLWDSLTLQSRPTGDTGPRPIIPTARRLEMHLGGHSLVMSKPFDLAMPEAANVKLVLQEDYRAVQSATAASKTSDPQLDQKVLGYWGLKYGVPDPQNYFIPPDMVKVAPIAPTTTITESFNTADSSTLGPDLAWTEDSGDFQVVSNAAAKTTNTSGQADNARANTSLSSADHYAQLVVSFPSGGLYMGPAARVASGKNFYSSVSGSGSPATDNNLYLVKEVAGVQTNMQITAVTVSAGDTIKVQANGTTITDFVNGTQKNNITDSAISGNLQCGINQGVANAGGTMDSFQAADLAAAGGPFPMFTTPALDGIGSYGSFRGNRPS